MSNNYTPALSDSKWTAEQIAILRKTIAKDATPEELTMFLYLSDKHNLDPFANEIWFVQVNGRNKILTARDGYLKIANESPHYRGMDSDVVHAKDFFQKQNDYIIHRYNGNDRGPIIGAYALVFRDDRLRPSYFYAPMSDYDKRQGAWKNYPHAMILKVAEAMALKRAFAISGLCTQEEVTPEEHKPIDFLRERKVRLWREFLKFFPPENNAKIIIQKITGIKPSSEWTPDDLAKLEKFITNPENTRVEVDAELI